MVGGICRHCASQKKHKYQIYVAPWNKLPTGYRPCHWKPAEQAYLADQQLETLQCVLMDRKHLQPMYRLMGKYFLLLELNGVSKHLIFHVLKHHSDTTLSHTPSLLA